MSSASYQSTVGALFSIFSSNLGPPSLEDFTTAETPTGISHSFSRIANREHFTHQETSKSIPLTSDPSREESKFELGNQEKSSF